MIADNPNQWFRPNGAFHYEVEVTPNPIDGPVFCPIHSNGKAIQYDTLEYARLVLEIQRNFGSNIRGYQVRIILVNGNHREVVF